MPASSLITKAAGPTRKRKLKTFLQGPDGPKVVFMKPGGRQTPAFPTVAPSQSQCAERPEKRDSENIRPIDELQGVAIKPPTLPAFCFRPTARERLDTSSRSTCNQFRRNSVSLFSTMSEPFRQESEDYLVGPSRIISPLLCRTTRREQGPSGPLEAWFKKVLGCRFPAIPAGRPFGFGPTSYDE